MCNAKLGLGLGLGGLGIGVLAIPLTMYSNYQQGQQQKNAYEAQAQIANQNAQIANQQALAAREQGGEKMQEMGLKAAQINSEGRAAYAANGVMLGSGSEFDWEVGTQQAYEIDRNEQQYNTDMQEWAYKAQAENYRNQASIDTWAGNNAETNAGWNMAASAISGAGSLLSSGSGLAFNWLNATKSSASGGLGDADIFSNSKWSKYDSSNLGAF